MEEGLGNTGASFLSGKVATLFFDLGKDFWNGVGWAGEEVTKFTLEHGQIIQIIARNKGGGRGKIQKLLDFCQAGAFVVIHMGKTKVWAVPNGRDFRVLPNNFGH